MRNINILLYALVALVPLCAVAQAPQSHSVTLAIHATASTGSDDYTDSTGSDGNVYSYRYTGGTGAGGDVTFHVGTPAMVVVHLSGHDYDFDGVTFPIDPNHQLSR